MLAPLLGGGEGMVQSPTAKVALAGVAAIGLRKMMAAR